MGVQQRVEGAIYGHLAGDALGVPYEFRRPEDLPLEISWAGGGSHGQPAGTYSDDGALMLCTMASLLDMDGFDPNDMGRRFVAWFDEGYMAAGGKVFDYGRATMAAISGLRTGLDAMCTGQGGEYDNGNGSLMRMVPVSLWTSTYPLEQQVSISHDCSRITHAHVRSQVCCALYSLLMRHVLSGSRPETGWEAAVASLGRLYSRSERWPDACSRELELVVDYRDASGSGYVVDSLRSSLMCLFGGDDYQSVVRAAVRLGRDTDTTACIAGGLAGAMFGLGSIPRDWRDGLRLDDRQREMIEEFARRCPLPGD